MCGRDLVASVLVCLVAVTSSYSSSDKSLALLSSTLKTMQRAACDDEVVSLSCPQGTSVSIQVAQYGKTAGTYNCQGESLLADSAGSQDKCLLPNSMQYSLLQTVVEACQKKTSCRFSTRLRPGFQDPCPSTKKFVEVAYKCRPNEYRVQSACEGDVVQLSCNPYTRVVVYEATYGRKAYVPITCPKPQGVSNETCLSEFATETVMKLCHGKRKCDVTANRKTFGSPCKPSTKTHLAISYNCVPLGVLTERYESAIESDEIASNGVRGLDAQNKDLYDENDVDGDKWGDATVVPAAPVANSPFLTTPHAANERITADEDDDITIHNIKRSTDIERGSSYNVLLYIAITIAIFICLVLSLIGVRCYIIYKSSRDSKPNDMYMTEVPNVFNDANSDIDNDADISHISGTFYEHPDMILYRDVPGSKGSIKAMRPMSTIYPCSSSNMYGTVDYAPSHVRVDSDISRRVKVEMVNDTDVVVSPKSLSRYSSPNFYYG